MNVRSAHLYKDTLRKREQKSERGILMKMKKIVAVAVSAALAVSMVAATAFAAETAPASPSATDKDSGKASYEVSGSASDALDIEVAVTAVSEQEESALAAAGSIQGYLGAEAYAKATNALGTSNLSISEIKQLEVSGYESGVGEVTAYMPFAALPKAGTPVVVNIKVVTANGNVVTLAVDGVVVERTTTVNGKTVTQNVVKVVLDGTTLINIEHGSATVSVVTAK